MLGQEQVCRIDYLLTIVFLLATVWGVKQP